MLTFYNSIKANRLKIFIKLFVVIAFFQCFKFYSHTQESELIDTNDWVESIINDGLALTSNQISILYDSPDSFITKRKNIALKYDSLTQIIFAKRNQLANIYEQSDSLTKHQVIKVSELFLLASIEKLLIPLWIGISWDFYGVPGKRPDFNRPIACGHFVQKILTDAGFNIKEKGSTWLAYLSPKNFIQSLLEKNPEDYGSWSNLIEMMKKDGSGLYIIGIEAGWGHVLFARYYGNEKLLLMHAGPHPKGASVNYDDGKYYLTEFENWEHIWAVRIGKEFVLKWLKGEPIIPCVEM